jgi:UDP-N-acetylmuramate dehydrogenase
MGQQPARRIAAPAAERRVTGPAIAGLPAVRGRLTPDAPVGRYTWLGAGGRAEMLFQPADREDLAGFLAALPRHVPVFVLGGGANLLVRDGGIPGVTIRLGRGFAGIAVEAEAVCVGAAARHLGVALAAAKAGRTGLEFLSGIPGTIGGGLRMNAGAYGGEMQDVLISAVALDRDGANHALEPAAMRLSYRNCGLSPDWIFLAARLRAAEGDRAEIARRLASIRAAREASQPIRSRTGGSTFANPPGETAWRLVEAAGCRGLLRGGAMISPQHANFLVNTGSATAADLEELGEEVRRRVFENSGILLEWEIRRVGRPLASGGAELVSIP